ncbi:drug resistance transporter [Xylaria bambusicola]|uniref:drug resistance transporter n=1 Tax=Xylaria bambusicola TaxID=326684 RepID=UPI002007FDE9|nr:drug resistance transporter [Xylaria bambusicola]KAI0506653.1 drug resistance transporter [Xylaria bambusicola]
MHPTDNSTQEYDLGARKDDIPLPSEEVVDEENTQTDHFNFLTGWRFYVVAAVLQLALFLVNFEITIVSTALVSISNDLNDFSKTSWVVTAYLITYTAGLVIVAKLSDIFGRKRTYLVALLIFTAFSGGCGGSQTIVQLIVFRAFQGVGGGGLYAVAFVMLFELVPKSKYPLLLVTSVALAVLGNALGPIFGGLITQRSTWRWVFLLNVPVGAAAILCVLFAVPNDYPYQGLYTEKSRSKPKLSSIDFAGGFLMLLALALLITGLNEAASTLTWISGTVLAPIIVSAFAWGAFFICQWWYSHSGSSIQSVFPWRFCKSRLVMGIILNSFFTGTISITLIILLPLRYQTTLGVGPLEAGVKLLPFVLLTSTGAALTGALVKGRRLAPVYVALCGIILQIAGLAALPSIETSNTGVYGLQVIIGLGAGFNIGVVTLMTPYVVEHKDLAVATAAGTQFRFLGSAVVVSITTAVGNSLAKAKLLGILTPQEIQEVFRSSASIDKLSPQLEIMVRKDFVSSFDVQFRIVLGFAVASLISISLLWKKKQIMVD